MNTTTALGNETGGTFCLKCADELPRRETAKLSYFRLRERDCINCDRCGKQVGK